MKVLYEYCILLQLITSGIPDSDNVDVNYLDGSFDGC